MITLLTIGVALNKPTDELVRFKRNAYIGRLGKLNFTMEQHKMKTDYNGWTNRETWVINLWLGEYFRDAANEGQSLMADYIEETVWDMLEEAEVPPMFKDLIDLGAVSWQELAEHYVTDEEVA